MPPRPARIQYLSQSARIPLDKLRNQVSNDLDNAIAQETLVKNFVPYMDISKSSSPKEEYNRYLYISLYSKYLKGEPLTDNEEIYLYVHGMGFDENYYLIPPTEVEEELVKLGPTEELEEKEEVKEELKTEGLEEKAQAEEKKVEEKVSVYEQLQQKSREIGRVQGKIQEAIDEGNMPLANKLEKEYQKLTSERTEIAKQDPTQEIQMVQKIQRGVDEPIDVSRAEKTMIQQKFLREQKQFEEGLISGSRIEQYRPERFKSRGAREAFEKVLSGQETMTIERAEYLQREGYMKTGPASKKSLRGSMAEDL